MSDDERGRYMPSTERLNALAALSGRDVILRHRAAGAQIATVGPDDGELRLRDPWTVPLPAVPKISDTLGPLPAEDDRLREELREALRLLVLQVEQIIRESGDPERSEGFNAAHWLADFLVSPHPALGGRRPSAFMCTSEGRQQVTDLVARIQTGAYG